MEDRSVCTRCKGVASTSQTSGATLLSACFALALALIALYSASACVISEAGCHLGDGAACVRLETTKLQAVVSAVGAGVALGVTVRLVSRRRVRRRRR